MEGFVVILVAFDGTQTYRAYSVEARAVEAAKAAVKTYAQAIVVTGKFYEGAKPRPIQEPYHEQCPQPQPAAPQAAHPGGRQYRDGAD